MLELIAFEETLRGLSKKSLATASSIQGTVGTES
jgi:hypothetical protein